MFVGGSAQLFGKYMSEAHCGPGGARAGDSEVIKEAPLVPKTVGTGWCLSGYRSSQKRFNTKVRVHLQEMPV